MSDATSGAPGLSGVLGLKGIWATLSNLGAVGLVCLMFYQAQADFRNQASQDRVMFREELKQLYTRSDHQLNLIRENQRTLTELTLVIRDAVTEIKRFRQE